MYVPAHFAEPDLATLHALIRTWPLATIVTLTADGLDANHIPMLLDAEASRLGTLRGHVARANPIWQRFRPEVETLLVFAGVDAYVSPSWYVSKARDPRVVPTWNYEAVHVHGTLTIVDEADWLHEQLDALTTAHETAFDEPWQMSDAPADYTRKLIGAIVGIEIEISRIVGKRKLSQNRSAADQDGVVAGLQALPEAAGCPMAQRMLTTRR